MDYGLTVTVPPVAEPVTLARAKAHLRIDHDDEDENIAAAIKAARMYAETHTSRYFLDQTIRVKLSAWPSDSVIWLEMFGANDVTAVDSVAYLDADGVSQTISAANYQSELSTNPPCIAPETDYAWPSVEAGRLYPITITLSVGAASPAALDPRIGQAILLTLGYWDSDRGDASLAANGASLGLPEGAKRLLDSIWTGAY